MAFDSTMPPHEYHEARQQLGERFSCALAPSFDTRPIQNPKVGTIVLYQDCPSHAASGLYIIMSIDEDHNESDMSPNPAIEIKNAQGRIVHARLSDLSPAPMETGELIVASASLRQLEIITVQGIHEPHAIIEGTRHYDTRVTLESFGHPFDLQIMLRDDHEARELDDNGVPALTSQILIGEHHDAVIAALVAALKHQQIDIIPPQ